MTDREPTMADTAEPNRVRARWEGGEVALDLWVSGASVTAIEAIGRLEFDSVILDMQHSPFEFSDILAALIALSGGRPSPIVRVPSNDAATIGKVLDAGAHGVLCPLVNSRAEAEAFVRAMRYPPLGERSFGPLRVPGETAGEYFERANDSLLAIAQIETVEAIEAVEEISSVPGLDMLFVGPADLSISAGGPAVLDCSSDLAVKRHRRVVAAAHGAGIRAGMIALEQETVTAGIGWGMDFLSLGWAQTLMLAAAGETLARGRAAALSQ
jgi:4-hydroxy-2-oxoheptanedioate aldolase